MDFAIAFVSFFFFVLRKVIVLSILMEGEGESEKNNENWSNNENRISLIGFNELMECAQ